MKKLAPILFSLLLASTTHAAWSLPTAPPPSGNPDSPINAGPNTQTKTGDLTVATQFTTNDIWTNLFRLATNAGTGKVLVSDALGNASWTATSTLGLGGSGGSTNYWSASGNDIFNNNIGNVGIGTANPGSLLSLGTGFGQKLGIYEAASDFYGLGAVSSGSGALTLYAGAPNDAAKLTIGSNGNVGIGTASPGVKLDVAGEIRAVATAPNNAVTIKESQGRSWAFYPSAYNELSLWTTTIGNMTTFNGGANTIRTNANTDIGIGTAPVSGVRVSVLGGNNGVNSKGVVGFWGDGSTHDFLAQHGTYNSVSSIRWKNNLGPILDALDKVGALRGVYFDWDEEHGGKRAIGMIAEEVGKIIPEIVSYEKDGKYATGMDYSKLTPLLVEAVKELKSEKDAEIAQLKTIICEDHPEKELCRQNGTN